MKWTVIIALFIIVGFVFAPAPPYPDVSNASTNDSLSSTIAPLAIGGDSIATQAYVPIQSNDRPQEVYSPYPYIYKLDHISLEEIYGVEDGNNTYTVIISDLTPYVLLFNSTEYTKIKPYHSPSRTDIIHSDTDGDGFKDYFATIYHLTEGDDVLLQFITIVNGRGLYIYNITVPGLAEKTYFTKGIFGDSTLYLLIFTDDTIYLVVNDTLKTLSVINFDDYSSIEAKSVYHITYKDGYLLALVHGLSGNVGMLVYDDTAYFFSVDESHKIPSSDVKVTRDADYYEIILAYTYYSSPYDYGALLYAKLYDNGTYISEIKYNVAMGYASRIDVKMRILGDYAIFIVDPCVDILFVEYIESHIYLVSLETFEVLSEMDMEYADFLDQGIARMYGVYYENGTYYAQFIDIINGTLSIIYSRELLSGDLYIGALESSYGNEFILATFVVNNDTYLFNKILPDGSLEMYYVDTNMTLYSTSIHGEHMAIPPRYVSGNVVVFSRNIFFSTSAIVVNYVTGKVVLVSSKNIHIAAEYVLVTPQGYLIDAVFYSIFVNDSIAKVVDYALTYREDLGYTNGYFIYAVREYTTSYDRAVYVYDLNDILSRERAPTVKLPSPSQYITRVSENYTKEIELTGTVISILNLTINVYRDDNLISTKRIENNTINTRRYEPITIKITIDSSTSIGNHSLRILFINSYGITAIEHWIYIRDDTQAPSLTISSLDTYEFGFDLLLKYKDDSVFNTLLLYYNGELVDPTNYTMQATYAGYSATTDTYTYNIEIIYNATPPYAGYHNLTIVVFDYYNNSGSLYTAIHYYPAEDGMYIDGPSMLQANATGLYVLKNPPEGATIYRFVDAEFVKTGEMLTISFSEPGEHYIAVTVETDVNVTLSLKVIVDAIKYCNIASTQATTGDPFTLNITAATYTDPSPKIIAYVAGMKLEGDGQIIKDLTFEKPDSYPVDVTIIAENGMEFHREAVIVVTDNDAPEVNFLGVKFVFDLAELHYEVKEISYLDVDAYYESSPDTIVPIWKSRVSDDTRLVTILVDSSMKDDTLHIIFSDSYNNKVELEVPLNLDRSPPKVFYQLDDYGYGYAKLTVTIVDNAYIYDVLFINISLASATFNNATVWIYNVRVNKTINGRITIYVYVEDARGNNATYEIPVYIQVDNEPPEVSYYGTTVTYGESELFVTFYDESNYTYRIYVSEGVTYEISPRGETSIVITLYSKTVQIAEVTIYAEDVRGNGKNYTAYVWIKLDTEAPKVYLKDVSQIYDGHLSVIFEIHDETSYEVEFNAPVNYTMTEDLNEVRVWFTRNETITFNATLRVVDSFGNEFVKTYEFTIIKDTTPPQVIVIDSIIVLNNESIVTLKVVDDYSDAYLSVNIVTLNGKYLEYNTYSEDGLYLITFTPDAEGVVEINVTASDSVGNLKVYVLTFNVSSGGLLGSEGTKSLVTYISIGLNAVLLIVLAILAMSLRRKE